MKGEKFVCAGMKLLIVALKMKITDGCVTMITLTSDMLSRASGKLRLCTTSGCFQRGYSC